ncbi:hypothetical protein HBI55_254530 [Parastagonospora nodorum]|nr:hypothetical protein HBI55_254530 [Parastagonospora nodorum]
MDIFLDPGSQLNLMSTKLAKEQGLEVTPLTGFLAEGVGEGNLTIYGTTVADVVVIDSRGKKENHEIPFVVTDLKRYPIYLGLPWVDEHNPKINTPMRRLLHRGHKAKDAMPYRKVGIEDAEEFERSMRSPHADVYAFLVSYAGPAMPEQPRMGQIPSDYAAFADVGSEEDSKVLAGHSKHDLTIDLVPGEDPPHRPLYNLSPTELGILRAYITEYLQRGWIRRSKSPAGAPILFVKKKDGTMRLCVDYRGLNKISIKNRGSLPLIMESLERLSQAKWYTKLDVREAYHRIRIAEGDEWKTAFRTRYGHFEYTVMPFGLTNAPAQFQAYINEALAGLMDISCIVYLDDILVFSDTEEEHVVHVKEVLQRLRDAKLYIKLSKCEWHTQRTEYLGYIISPEGVSVDQDRVKTIQDWPLPRTVREIRVFIGFMNYYRRFIAGFSRLALPLTILTQKTPGAARGGPQMRREESQTLKIGPEGVQAFQALKDAFLNVPILVHFEQGRETRVEVDASGGAISGILSQLVPEDGKKPQWRPVDFYSRKLIAAEYRYDTHDQELLAIVKSLEHWRQYLEGTTFEVLTDHKNLKWFMETKTLNHRQVRAYLVLSRYDFTITHRSGKTNPADGPSRRPDYMDEAQKPSQKHNHAFVEPLRRALWKGGKDSFLVSAVSTRAVARTGEQQEAIATLRELRREDQSRLVALEPEADDDPSSESGTDIPDTSGPESGQDGPQRLKVAHKAPKVLHTTSEKAEAMCQCHDDPLAGHFGARRTIEKLQRRYTWKGLRKNAEEYCRSCEVCKRAKPARHKPYGLLAPLPPPTRPWEDVTMDFITELPPSKLSGVVYDAILVIVCRLTKMSHYVPARGDWDGVDLAQAWIREVIRLHGVPKRVISDRGPIMNAKHWDTFQHYMNSRRVLTSSFHPQTDGQTERQNQTLEHYLRCYCGLEQDDWALWLSLAEFAYNDSKHAVINMTPFQANQGLDPIGPDWPERPLGDGESPRAAKLAERVLATIATCRSRILAANEYQEKHANKRRLPVPFKEGDKVMVSTRNMRSTRPKKKLDWKFTPGVIDEQIGSSAFRVRLKGFPNVHPVFHASLLEPYDPTSKIPHPPTDIADTLHDVGGDDIYEVDKIVDRRMTDSGQWEYLVQWKNYSEDENSWEPGPNISGNTLRKFWDAISAQPRRKKREDGQANQNMDIRRRGRPLNKRRG